MFAKVTEKPNLTTAVMRNDEKQTKREKVEPGREREGEVLLVSEGFRIVRLLRCLITEVERD